MAGRGAAGETVRGGGVAAAAGSDLRAARPTTTVIGRPVAPATRCSTPSVGTNRPDSSRETADWVVPIRVASPACVSPAPVRARRTWAAIAATSMAIELAI
jgi:hypothetical protein